MSEWMTEERFLRHVKFQLRNFYAYKGTHELGQEPLGSDGRHIWKDLKTVQGARRRCLRMGWESFRIYTFSEFYSTKTFNLVVSEG